ncbi:hypothetical protein ACFYZI_41035 [Streptomyces griseorubiginosus]|uniref:hypothetical protein n=1 Tax=Streptomyces griseorubiginosus TaxID=67304 RepID=UPI0036AC2B90
MNLSVRHKLPAASLVDILDDLVNGLPEAAPDSLTVYATYDHFALDRDRPDIYSTAELGDFIGRDVAEEEIYLLDLANDMIQNGEALEALEHCCRAVSSIPDLLNTRWVKENLSLMCAFARLSGADGARLASCTAFLASHLDPAQENDGHAVEVRWKVPSAFGPDAPLISGVPAGYLVPEVYVQRGSLSPDESAMVYFLLLLFSSALRRQAAPVSELQHLRHLLIQAKFSRTWKEASPECREHLTEIYRHVSGGSSLTEVVESLGEVP